MVTSLLFAAALLGAGPTETLTGTAVDAWTMQPLASVHILDQEQREIGRSDEKGHFFVAVDRHSTRLTARLDDGQHDGATVYLPRDGDGRLLKADLLVGLSPLEPLGLPAPDAIGIPRPHPLVAADDAPASGPIFWDYPLPALVPATIRVLRCPGTTCCNAPGDGIQTMPFEEYVKGVVFGEVGIFRSMTTLDGQAQSTSQRQQGSAEVFKALAVGSRSYALYWYQRRADANPGYDIRDGTCEQVYDDTRHDWVNAAVDATAGQVLSSVGATRIDKYEYASSCKRQGTLPFGASSTSVVCTDIIADVTNHVACVNTWCGHDTNGMGHQDNPCTTECTRCLVRGVCQWGAAERSFGGESYTSILSHYQPQLSLVSLDRVGPGIGTLMGYVRSGSADNASAGVEGALVDLSLGQQTTTASDGYYEFTSLVADQTVTLTVAAGGFDLATADVFLDPTTGTWIHSIAITSIVPDGGIDSGAGNSGRSNGGCTCAGASLPSLSSATALILLGLLQRIRNRRQ